MRGKSVCSRKLCYRGKCVEKVYVVGNYVIEENVEKSVSGRSGKYVWLKCCRREVYVLENQVTERKM